MKKVAVIGSISTDFVVNTTVIPKEGQTVIGESFDTFFGGKGANQAIAISRAGVQTYMVGAVGDDTFGESLIDNLRNNQIDTSMVQKIINQNSGSAIIQVKNSDNRIIVVEGANAELTIEDITGYQEKLKEMDLIVLQNEIPVPVIEYVIRFCRDHQLSILYNPAPFKEISRELIDSVTYLTPNEHEFKQLYPDAEPEAQLKKMPNQLIITLGKKGAIFNNGREEKVIPACQVANVVDTTGAGDTFNGYFVSGLLGNLTLEQAIKLGNKASALAIQKHGAQSGIPRREEV